MTLPPLPPREPAPAAASPALKPILSRLAPSPPAPPLAAAAPDPPAAVPAWLAERLVALLPHADWALFQKNGTDATTLCVTIARAATGRRKVLVARNAYHGAAPWCSPYPSGVTAEDRAHLVYFDYNDLHSLQQALESVRGDAAAVIVSAFKHDFGRDQQWPSAEFAQGVRQLCDAHRAALEAHSIAPPASRALWRCRRSRWRCDPRRYPSF